MIDTLKIFTCINKKVYHIISEKSNIKCMYNKDTGEVFYEIINDSLEGTYDSRLSVRVLSCIKYNLFYKDSYCIEVEGSYHKIIKGHNAFDGFYNIQEIGLNFIKFVENAYDVKLPSLNHWFLQRVDITKSFDLLEQQKVCSYINSLKLISYPRRDMKFYTNETLYCPGQITTLKIYNKFLEFNKNDRLKVSRFINVVDFLNRIKGFIRFECEIKKKKLINIYNKKFIRLTDVKYSDLENVWSEEFMKILKFDSKNLKRVRTKEEVRDRLSEKYKSAKALRLYQFFITILNDGYDTVKDEVSSSSFYRNITDLKSAGIDFSQSNFSDISTVNFDNIIDFDPFLWKEVL